MKISVRPAKVALMWVESLASRRGMKIMMTPVQINGDKLEMSREKREQEITMIKKRSRERREQSLMMSKLENERCSLWP